MHNEVLQPLTVTEVPRNNPAPADKPEHHQENNAELGGVSWEAEGKGDRALTEPKLFTSLRCAAGALRASKASEHGPSQWEGGE